MSPSLTLSLIRYRSRVKWSNLGKGVAPSPTPWCSSYWKGSLRVTLDYGRQLYFFLLYYDVKVLHASHYATVTSLIIVAGNEIDDPNLNPGWDFWGILDVIGNEIDMNPHMEI